MYKLPKVLCFCLVCALAACGKSNTDQTTQPRKTTDSLPQLPMKKQEAEALSPVGLTCEVTEDVPRSRGRGHGVKIDSETRFYPAFLRGDVDNSGVIDREDAKFATQQFFKVEDVLCPRTADVGGAPQTLIPDGFFTSQDIWVFKEFRKTGVVTWPQDVICSFDCAVQK